ncbi:hypothetical protein AGDE_14546 [Angomonas deanei]|nr:hypothetical protein AGDE_14546 [Angomonas deanei]|eukprot:EPY20666.1 hypothetical protein AGDE_14546 [Angomonas deanei]
MTIEVTSDVGGSNVVVAEEPHQKNDYVAIPEEDEWRQRGEANRADTYRSNASSHGRQPQSGTPRSGNGTPKRKNTPRRKESAIERESYFAF